MARTPHQNIALIGFMAVGKSAVGRSLARTLRFRFVDLDRLIEKDEGLKVREIFAQKGEPYFRQLEKRTLVKVLHRGGQVIATGGGAILDEDNLILLQERAIVVGLTASVDVLLARAGVGSKRPLLSGDDRKEKIEKLLEQRQERYAQAAIIIDTSDLTIGQVVEKIIQNLGSNN